MNPKEMLSKLRNSFQSGKTLPLEFRKKQLSNLKKMYVENSQLIIDALASDLHKSKHESIIMEISFLINDINNVLSNIDDWVEPERPKKGLVNILDKLYIFNEPYGVVLVIGAWNYPFQLLLLPVAGAIAAGNCVVLKPSEVSANASKVISELIPKYLDPECYQVYTGGPKETSLLFEEKFDYIFYTGSSNVGKIIHQAASKNLTPVTLELGGKSPVYLDESADMEISAKRILWGKFANAGQTCVAPDYLLCTKSVEKKFIEIAKKVIREWYGEDPSKSKDFGRIVNEKHFQRIAKMLNSGTTEIGGISKREELYIAPTVLSNVKPSDPVMLDEIFGPVLPIVQVNNLHDVINFINNREKPLALYIFSKKKSDIDLLIKNTSCGGISVNDTIMHLCVDTIPFGGVGNSGMGGYHGKFTFDTFSHKKSCLYKNFGIIGEKLGNSRYPPFSEGKTKFLNFILKPRGYISFKFIHYFIAFGLGMLSMHFYSIQK